MTVRALEPFPAAEVAPAHAAAHGVAAADSSSAEADLRATMTNAVKAYAALVEASPTGAPAPIDPDAVTATEVVIVVSEMLRSMNLNLFDVAMWFNRPAAGAGAGSRCTGHDGAPRA
jgi:hypothetical protein